MKELEVYIIPEDLAKVSEIFDEYSVVARVMHDVQGSGRLKRKEILYKTGRMFAPKSEKRIHLMALVSDSSAKEIAEEILNNIGEESESRGLILIKEISNAYEIGTKKSGDSILTN